MIEPADVLELWAPAKVNLFLSVGKVDQRGYHPIRTIFQAVSLYDRILVGKAEGSTHVTFDDPSIPPANTVTKALAALGEFMELPPLQIRVEKGIPSEAGLGGGSSDAAAVLMAIQRLGFAELPAYHFTNIAASIGADVPFFLVGGRAWAEGYGELITQVSDPGTQWLVIAKPDTGCATKEMYARLDAIDYQWRDFPETDVLYNDFERVAPCESMELIERLLTHGAVDAGLSGSGSAVFGRFASESAAGAAASRLRLEGVPFAQAVQTLGKNA